MVFTRARGRTLGAAAAALVALPAIATSVLSAAPAQAVPAFNRAATPLLPVVIRHVAGGRASAEAAVTRAGGVVERRLTALDELTARVPASRVQSVATAHGVVAVTPDGSVRLAGKHWLADKDSNSLYSITKAAGVQEVWGRSDAAGQKITGKGIGVALIDSGIAPVPGLDASGKVVNGPDLSLESQAANLRYLDTFGHGTHLAGIIAGRDSQVPNSSDVDSKNFVGVAPDAHLINMKVAATDGAVDVSQVIAAIDWVVTHRADPGLNIKVINLSFGTDSTQDPRLDPLSYAVEAAWNKGIVVVVSAGNDGEGANRVAMPAANPYVIAVGAADPMGTDSRADDTVPPFSTRGTARGRHPDLVAAGKSVASLRNPNSFIDTMYPGGLVTTDPLKRLFRGSGTSQAAAVVSGAAALLLQQRPTLTPDQVKRLLMTTAEAMPKGDSVGSGAGQLDVKRALDAATPNHKQTYPASTGTGSLDKSRGSARLADPDTGAVLTGEVDIMGHAWTPSTWTTACAAGTAWADGTWNGTAWTGSGWTGSSWAARTWSSRTWSGTNWASRTWSSRTWSSATWNGQGWSSRTWSGLTWSSRTWSGGYWSSTAWR
jgi:serine protease AprX